MYSPTFYALSEKSVPHILEKIFFSLDYKSFKICMEVSNSWNQLLTSESFIMMGKSVFREVIEKKLNRASWDGNLREVRSILSSGMVNVNCISGHFDATPLSYASYRGHKNMVQLLLDRGAETNKGDDNFGFVPLHYATRKGNRDVAEMLLHGGADPDLATREEGWTPLHIASYYGHKDVVQLLLKTGAYPSNVTVNGRTPLSLALIRGHADIVIILRGGGALL